MRTTDAWSNARTRVPWPDTYDKDPNGPRTTKDPDRDHAHATERSYTPQPMHTLPPLHSPLPPQAIVSEPTVE